MTDNDPFSFREPQPTEARKAVYDQFVAEYVKDFNPIAACVRIGFNAVFAKEWSPSLMGQPYVQRKIMEYKTTPTIDEKDALEIARKRIESTFLLAMECGDPKVMVAAAKNYAEMKGLMQAPDRSGEALEKLVDHFKETAKHLPD
jgi:hypothetical protein